MKNNAGGFCSHHVGALYSQTLAALLAGAKSYTGVELSKVTELAAQLSEQYPSLDVTQDVEGAIAAVNCAGVLIIQAEPVAGSPLAAVRARATR